MSFPGSKLPGVLSFVQQSRCVFVLEFVMKLVISHETITRLNAEARSELGPVLQMLGVTADDLPVFTADPKEITHLENMSVTRQGSDWVFWVNDEVAFRRTHLFGKIVRFFAPIVLSLKSFISEIKGDLAKLETFITKEK